MERVRCEFCKASITLGVAKAFPLRDVDGAEIVAWACVNVYDCIAELRATGGPCLRGADHD